MKDDSRMMNKWQLGPLLRVMQEQKPALHFLEHQTYQYFPL
jgi:hypothetical protein